MELLRYDHVDISYNGVPAIQDVSFTLEPGGNSRHCGRERLRQVYAPQSCDGSVGRSRAGHAR